MTQITTREYADSLRQVADFYEQHPKMPLPNTTIHVYSGATREAAELCAREMAPCRKEWGTETEGGLHIKKTFNHLTLSAYFLSREVCERVVLGVEQVPEHVIPAHSREVVKWKCPPSLLGGE